MKILEIHFDAACHSKLNQDTPMGIGIHANYNGKELEYMYFNAGLGTVSIGEWIGCLEALKMGMDLGKDFDKVRLFGDSQLIVKQFTGEYDVKNERLQVLKGKSLLLLNRFPIGKFESINWVRRTYNQRADDLSKLGLAEPSVDYWININKFIK